MDKQEAKKVIKKLNVIYNILRDKEEEEIRILLNTYEIVFKDKEYVKVDEALNRLIAKSKFAPSISEIIEETDKIKENKEYKDVVYTDEEYEKQLKKMMQGG